MQRQIGGFVATLNQEISHRSAQQPFENAGNSLMPVIRINSITTTTRMESKRPVEIKRPGETKQKLR